MLKSKNKWVLDENKIEPKIDLPISNTVKYILARRGIQTTEEAKKFLYPTRNQLHDPFLFPDMNKAVNRIKKAIDNQEKILIYGDYDADGVTSTAVLMRTLTYLGANVNYYIPNRFTEGYGPNENAFQEAYELGYTLIITVDNGIAAPIEAQLLKSLNVDLIITDHHEAQDEIPEAYAIIHPQFANTYPFKHLAGVGVAFKLAHALLGEFPEQLLGLAAIGTVADLVPLVDENRVIVKEGIDVLNKSQIAGITALKEIANVDHIDENTIGFAFGPRLNAVGRLQDASLAVELLLEDDYEVALDIAKEIDDLNRQRQQLVSQIVEEAMIEIEENYKDDYIIVLAKENWNSGVLGIVASRIVNQYHRPTILLSINKENNEAKGSARSIPSFDMFEHGMALREYFLQFGGHQQAAGMTVAVDQIDILREKLNERAKQTLTKDDFVPKIEIEAEIGLADLNFSFPEQINMLAPFGMGNPKPIFQINDVQIDSIRRIGSKLNHLKLIGIKDEQSFDMIGFQLGELANQLASKSTVSVVGEIEINEWNGHKKIQLVLKDIASNEVQIFDYRGNKNWQQLNDQIVLENIAILSFKDFVHEIPSQIPVINFEKETIINRLTNIENIILIDLPKNIDDLIYVLQNKRFNIIYVCFQNDSSYYFEQIPSREQFKVLYATLYKNKSIFEHQKQQLADAKKWTLSQLDFMLNVFLDLNFVTIKNGEIIIQKDAKQQPLTNSKTYQQRLKDIEIEKILYYSHFDDLKQWMLLHMASVEEGAVLNGL